MSHHCHRRRHHHHRHRHRRRHRHRHRHRHHHYRRRRRHQHHLLKKVLCCSFSQKLNLRLDCAVVLVAGDALQTYFITVIRPICLLVTGDGSIKTLLSVCLSVCLSIYLSVCSGRVSSDTAERIWLKFCTGAAVYLGYCVLHFGSDRPRGPARGSKIWFS